MAITPGTRIGAYQVTSQLGEGGMGVVFRAQDTKLLRDVAIKLLPDHFADDPDRLLRLQREAQLLASVNHPNIAQIYGLEQVGSAGCIVMELVEGETLAERIARGPLPLDEAMEIARQVADALAAAHERGIVHRDLKPANIKLTPNGTVKVLDFGLAKTVGARGEDKSHLSTMPTKMSRSVVGAVVGTPAYMSPEQSRGKEVDARTDIWAFGCVLYEMLTGHQAFNGETVTDILAHIVTGQPDMNLLPAATPNSIRLLLEASMNKNVHQRLQHIGDMRLFLDEKFFPRTKAAGPEAAVAAKASRAPLMIALAVAVLAIVAAAALYFRPAPVTSAVPMHFELSLSGIVGAATISPDGQRIAYVAPSPDGIRSVWLRPIGSDAAQKLPNTENANGLLWSPDSRYLAFLADGKLRKVDLATGGVQLIGDTPGQIRGASWSRKGVILLNKGNVLARVPDSGGEVTPLTVLDGENKETLHAVPVFLPDDNHYLYVIVGGSVEHSGIFVGALDSKEKQRLLPLPNRITSMAYVAPGYFLLAGDSLNAWRLDADKLTIDPQAMLVAEGLDAGFSVSDNGVLLYRKGGGGPPLRQLTWYSREGKPVGQIGTTAANYGTVEISPAGDRVAVDMIANNNRDIWVVDIARAVPSRITFDAANDWSPSWSSDGKQIIFASSRGNANHIYRKASSGVGSDELVYPSQSSEIPVHWSADGKHVVFSQLKQGDTQRYDTWVFDLAEKKAFPFIESPFDKAHARISPDNSLIAYASNDTGMFQIVVQSFPDPNGGKWQITAQGGVEPKWRRDGRELYYLGLDGKLMAVSVKPDHTFGTPVELFESPLQVNRTTPSRDRRYDVAADGRFLFATPTATASPGSVIAVVNWASALAKAN